MKNPLGYAILYAYDDTGRCIRTWGQDGLYDERFEYYPEVHQSIRRSATGAEWVFTYDSSGTAVEVMDPYGDVRQFVVDDFGRVVLDVDEIGQETELLYDPWGGHCARRTPLGDIQPPRHVDLHPPERPLLKLPRTPLEWRWGGLVRPERIAATMARSAGETHAATREVRDGMERLVAQTDQRGRTQQWRYDSNGNAIEHVDADGRAVRTEIASWNLARRRFDPNGAAVQYDYNLHEYVTKIVDPGGAVSEYVYDLKDRIAEVRRHGATRERYAWDGAGNLIEKRDAADQMLLRIGIGPQGLPVKRSLASGQTHEMEYDALGHVTRAATGTSETVFQRDGAGRVLADLRDSLGIKHTIAFGRVSETVVFGKFRTEFDFDQNGAAVITDPTGRTVQLRYSSDGRIERTFAGGLSETCTYDADGQLLERVLVQPGAEPSAARFVYSPGGDLLERHAAEGVTRFEYDAAHRLIAETSPGGVRVEYDRDLAGNLLRMPGLHGVQLIEGNRLVAANSATFTYNNRNHIASRTGADGQIDYEYDSQDMLVRAVIDGQEWTAEYDPLGRRIRKTWQGQTTEFYWDDNRLAAEVRPDQSCRIYWYADLEALVPIMMIDYDSIDADPQQGRVYHLLADQRGCVEQVVDATGKTVWSARIDPYGTAHVDPASEIELHLRMPGHYFDPETGLHDNRFRSYSPELGRYLQSDPIGQSGGTNLYAYCHNPLTQVDLVGWSHSNDVGGSKKSKNAESPSPAKLGDSSGAEAVAAKGGMDPGHVKNLQKHCADNNRMVVMRAGNEASVPHIKDPNGVPKPVECKLNTAKSGDNAGKVTTGQSPDKWKSKSEGGSGYKENLDDLKKKDYSVEDGVVKNPDDKYVHGDYDMQGVYDKGPDGKYGPPKKERRYAVQRRDQRSRIPTQHQRRPEQTRKLRRAGQGHGPARRQRRLQEQGRIAGPESGQGRELRGG
jgi:RHS repeat-associated protein